MTVLPFVTAVIFGLMLAEARVSRQHEARLIARGAIAAPEPGYVVMSVLYPSCFFAMGAEGVVRQAGVSGMFVSGALMFAAAKFLKYWAIGITLGERWTFRVYLVPGVPLASSGPYRYVTHPNYAGVVGELIGVAMMTEARVTGPVAVLSFGVVLWRRIAFETRAIADAQGALRSGEDRS